MLHVLVAFATALSGHAVARPRVASLCMSLLAIQNLPLRTRLGTRSLDVVARARAAARRLGENQDRLIELETDLYDPKVLKALIDADGAANMRDVSEGMLVMSRQLDGPMDQVPPFFDEEATAQTRVLDVSPVEGDRFYHLTAGVHVSRNLKDLLDLTAAHEEVDLLDLKEALRPPTEAPRGGYLLLFDQLVYRKSTGPDYTYLGVVRLREPALHRTH